MMVKQLYNIQSKNKRRNVTVEFLQVSKLYNEGTIEYLDISEMKPQVVVEGKIKTHGKPLEVELDDGEYLVAVSRIKLHNKSMEAHIRIQLYSADGQALPIQAFTGYFGDVSGKKGFDFWKFPMVDATVNLHTVMFPTSVSG